MGDSGTIRPHQLFVTSTTNALYDRVQVPGGKEHQFASRALHPYPGARFAALRSDVPAHPGMPLCFFSE